MVQGDVVGAGMGGVRGPWQSSRKGPTWSRGDGSKGSALPGLKQWSGIWRGTSPDLMAITFTLKAPVITEVGSVLG